MTLDDTPAAAAAPAATPAATARRPSALGVLVAVLVVVLGGAVFAVTRPALVPAPKSDIPLDAWAPYWALDDSLPEFEQRVGLLRDISPFWFNATGVSTIEIDRNARDEDIEQFMSIANKAGANVVPSRQQATRRRSMARHHRRVRGE